MGRREEADSALRKDMFQSILSSFVQPTASQEVCPKVAGYIFGNYMRPKRH